MSEEYSDDALAAGLPDPIGGARGRRRSGRRRSSRRSMPMYPMSQRKNRRADQHRSRRRSRMLFGGDPAPVESSPTIGGYARSRRRRRR